MCALLDVPNEELQSWLKARGQPPMRVRQLRRWLLLGRAESFEQMTDLPRNCASSLWKSICRSGSRSHATW